MKSWACAALLVAGVSAGLAVHAQTTIFRCTDTKGEMTVQNAPCPEGSRQDKRQVKDVATQPLPSARKSAPAPEPVRATSASDPPAATLSSKTGTPPPLHLSAKPDTPAVAAVRKGPATTIYRCTDAKGQMSVQNAPCPPGSKTDKRAVQGVASMPLPGKAPATPRAAAEPASANTPSGTAAVPASQQGESSRSSALAMPDQDQAPIIQTIGGMTLIQDPTLQKNKDDAADALAGRSAPARPAEDAPAGMVTGTAPPILFQCTTYDSGTYLTEEIEPQSRCAPVKTVGLDGNVFSNAGTACQVIHDVCGRVPDQKLCSAWNKRLGETEVAWRYAREETKARNKADYERVLRIVKDAGCAK